MDAGKFPFDNLHRLKGWINNSAEKNKLMAGTVLQPQY